MNDHHKTKGLNARNNFIGAGDWLDVYPNGELEILGNVDFIANPLEREHIANKKGEK